MTGGEFKAGLFLASISEKLLSREISEWSKDRKFNFAEIVNFQAPRPPANIRPQRIEQAGGAAKILPPRRAKRHAHVPFFVGGLPRTPSSQAIFPAPVGDITDQARPTPLKQRSDFFELARKNRLNAAS
ncbi:hypothetical protein ACRS85_08705 [Pluralibacter gergoviae]|uniref:hypothetical protein n=1 Tax=Pluralibacter gergoviae TaxID=61647 RepID=UPI003EE2B3EA